MVTFGNLHRNSNENLSAIAEQKHMALSLAIWLSMHRIVFCWFCCLKINTWEDMGHNRNRPSLFYVLKFWIIFVLFCFLFIFIWKKKKGTLMLSLSPWITGEEDNGRKPSDGNGRLLSLVLFFLFSFLRYIRLTKNSSLLLDVVCLLIV